MRFSYFLLLLLSQSQVSFQKYAAQTIESHDGLPRHVFIGKEPGNFASHRFARSEVEALLQHEQPEMRAMAYCTLLQRESVEAWWAIVQKGLDDLGEVTLVGGCSPVSISISELLLNLYESKQAPINSEQIQRILTISSQFRVRNRLLITYVPNPTDYDLIDALRQRVWQGDWAPLVPLARVGLPEDDSLILEQLQLLEADSVSWLQAKSVFQAVQMRPRPEYLPDLLRLVDELTFYKDSPLLIDFLFGALAHYPGAATDQRLTQLIRHNKLGYQLPSLLAAIHVDDFPAFTETLFVLLEEQRTTRADMLNFMLARDYERTMAALTRAYQSCFSHNIPKQEVLAIGKRLLKEPVKIHEPILTLALLHDDGKAYTDLVNLMKHNRPAFVIDILLTRFFQDRSWNRDDIQTVETLIELAGPTAITAIDRMIEDEDHWWERKRSKLPTMLHELRNRLDSGK